jgi:secreted PhoX family phosphatase
MTNLNKRKKQLLLLLLMGISAGNGFAQMSQTFVRSVSSGTDDAEEYVPGGTGTIGAMDLTSSDLELMLDGTKKQIVGIRFSSITIPQGATIERAYVQFTNKGDKTPVLGDVYITAQDADNAGTFTTTPFDITSRLQVADSVLWAGNNDVSWGTAAGGTADANQRTPDIKSVLQPVINRTGWAQGSAVVVLLKGAGVRNTYSYNGSAAFAPQLIIEYTSPSVPAMLVGGLPVNKLSEWKYLDNGTDQGTAWTGNSFNDASWSYGPAKLGYGLNPVTTLDYGADPNNKFLTYYFRKHLNIPDVSALADSLDLSLLRDDGAVVYINGAEVVRSNMPAGTINYLTQASTAISGTGQSAYSTFRVASNMLVNGSNTIAVEIHQNEPASSDIVFDLELKEVPHMAITNFPVAANSEWKYLDNGTDLGTSWTGTSFNDTTWSYGPGKLGYSDNPATTVSYGSDPNNKYITTYFRKNINVTNLAALTDTLKLGLLRDDGAIVYINGTEVVRSNMPAGPVDYLTWAPTIVDAGDESVYFQYLLPKTVLTNGINTIAVEIHQRDGTSSDLGFDMSFAEYVPPTPSQPCAPLAATHISSFTSVIPSAQPDSLRIPATHTFQMLVQSGDAYTNPADGVTKGTFDFTGYVPIAGSSTNGYLSINHENGSWPTAGVSMLSLNYSAATQLWSVTNNVPVDFGSGSIAGTGRNCSGAVTPWNTIITCEETLPGTDANSDGYQDIGWAVEIDPATHTIVDHNYDGQPDKLWKLGLMSHENVVVDYDHKTVYEGNDQNPGFIFKMVADTAGKLGSGNLYVLKLTGSLGSATTGTWLQVPNSTPAECNNVTAYAASVSATNFNSIEDVEISPLDSMVYFTSKASGSVYRFKDHKTVGTNTDVVNCEVFVGNSSSVYTINYGTGTANEQWRGGNDNLTFDGEGNLYVLQDGDRNHIWMVKPCHTQADPKVELFAVTPDGCEPTGMTFSPDYKFMFVSMQHPSSTNTTAMTDAAGNAAVFNKESAIVIARKEFLGTSTPLPVTFSSFDAFRTPNNKAELKWQYITDETIARFEVQRMVSGNAFETLETIQAVAQKKELNKYSYIDQNPYAGKNFYRIKAIGDDGKETYTNIRVVDIAVADRLALVSTYPNPATQTFNIALVSPEQKAAVLHVYNTTGSMVMEQQATLKQGNNLVEVNIAQLPAGLYHISLMSGNDVLKAKVVKQ